MRSPDPDFDAAIAVLLSDEGGGYNPSDEGRGASKWGITSDTFRELHPGASDSDIEALTRGDAIQFYWDWAWVRDHFALLNSRELKTKLLDLGANIGLGTAIKFLQRGLGVKDDGILGSQTAQAANLGEPKDVIITNMIAAGKRYYDEDVKRNPRKQKYYDGWIARLTRRYPDQAVSA